MNPVRSVVACFIFLCVAADALASSYSYSVTVNGAAYASHSAPLHEVGILLDAKAVHPGRSARGHLRALAATHGISNRRVDEVIGLTGLDDVECEDVSGREGRVYARVRVQGERVEREVRDEALDFERPASCGDAPTPARALRVLPG